MQRWCWLCTSCGPDVEDYLEFFKWLQRHEQRIGLYKSWHENSLKTLTNWSQILNSLADSVFKWFLWSFFATRIKSLELLWLKICVNVFPLADGVCGEESHSGWDLPERRLHPFKGNQYRWSVVKIIITNFFTSTIFSIQFLSVL